MISLLSYSIWSGVLGSPDLLLSYSVIVNIIAHNHHTNNTTLSVTLKSTDQLINYSTDTYRYDPASSLFGESSVDDGAGGMGVMNMNRGDDENVNMSMSTYSHGSQSHASTASTTSHASTVARNTQMNKYAKYASQPQMTSTGE